MMLWSGARRRALRLGVPFSISVEDVTIPPYCPVLGIPLAHNWGGRSNHDASPTLDRIIPEVGYVPHNIIVISNKANRIKTDASISEVRRVADFYEKRIRLLGKGKPNADSSAVSD